MLGYPADVRDVVLGEGGLLEAMDEGALYIDVTTSEPSLAVEIAQAAAAKGVAALDAPVSGGDVGARNGTLVVMVGGEPEAFARAKPLLEAFGQTVVLMGGPGSGQHTKMVNQIAISSGMVAVCEALLYAHRSGLDLEQVLDTISRGAAGSWTLSNLAPRLLTGDVEPGFKVDHFVKDLGIALAEARRMQLSLPGLALAEQLYIAAQAQGLGQKGTHALLLALARVSAVDWPATPS
jgi:3-hydroxyisobutyrate dehydrogenase